MMHARVGRSLIAAHFGDDELPAKRAKRDEADVASNPSRSIVDNIDHITATIHGKKIGKLAGCFCPPHKGHYASFFQAITDLNLDMLFITSVNRKTFTRHGTPLEHTYRALSMFARQLQADTGAEVYVMSSSPPTDDDFLPNFYARYEWVPATVGHVYDIANLDNPSDRRSEPRTLAQFNRSFFPQLKHNEYNKSSPSRDLNEKYSYIQYDRPQDSVSATKFSRCLEKYQKTGLWEDKKACYKFINHLSQSDMDAYLEDVLQYKVYERYTEDSPQ